MKFEEEMRVVGSHADGKLLAGRMGPIGVVLFNQPAKHNAISLDMWEGLCSALDQLESDGEVRVVVYAGAGGKAFMSGADISQFGTRRNTPEASAEYARINGRGRERMTALAKPSIACINGYCLGGGVATALQADLRVAAPDAVFGITAARMGIAYGMDNMERLVAAVGPARAKLVLYTGRRFTAAEALAMGLVDVLAQDDAVGETLELARTIADNAPLSVRASKFMIEQTLKEAGARDPAAAAEITQRCLASADYREGRTAFMEKRKPVFSGA
jgi:enoyl-CoA hydratase